MSRNRPHFNSQPQKFWIFCALLFIALTGTADAEPTFSKSAIPKARVAIVERPGATEMFLPQPDVIHDLFRHGLLHFTSARNETEAWRTLVSSNDTIGIKVFSSPGTNSGTRPAVVAALIQSLLRAGISPGKIIVWDKEYSDLRRAGFTALEEQFKVRVLASGQFGWDETIFYESSILGTPVWGDLEFGQKGDKIGRKSYVSKLLTQQITKIISVTPLLNHNLSGVAGHLYSLALSSVDNSIRFDSRRQRLETAVPEIVGLPEIYDRLVLNITDALICQYQGEQRTLLHYSAPLNQLWFSKDPVALDVLALSELERQRKLAGNYSKEFTTELYSNASLLELGISETKSIAVDKAK